MSYPNSVRLWQPATRRLGLRMDGSVSVCLDAELLDE
jgi:hypothetical protein